MTDVAFASRGWFRLFLNFAGVVVVGWDSVTKYEHGILPLWAFACILAADAAWLCLVFIRPRWSRAGLVCVGVMILGGGLAAPATSAVGIVPIAVALLLLTRSPGIRLRIAIALGLAAMALVLIGDVLYPIAPLGLLAIEAGVIVAFLSGQSRRQFVVSEQQERRLLESRIAVREEQARADVLAARQNIAHDIHDVLAHSLGGLVIQLDAVDALLEAGETGAAVDRVRDARMLAAEGLTEARRAVATLREVPEGTDELTGGQQLMSAIEELLEAHRALGGSVDLVENGERREVAAALATAVRRAVQEALTNARKHAPGMLVSVTVTWTSHELSVRVSNPLPASKVAASGGGHGLVGMRERFAVIPGAGATAEIQGDSFVVMVSGASA
ncbi:MAG: two-component sensor histidine kinase [Glaciihabitans sp.]|nr:two-component sensor histidine kinase [Glaciihabitans sp.]